MELETSSLFRKYFIYVDVADKNLADNVFIRNKLRVNFDSDVARPDKQFKGVICSVRKRDAEVFKKCMSELVNVVILRGYTGYEEFCESMFEYLKDEQ